MSDYSGFKVGGATYPLSAAGTGPGGRGASLLRDADPTLFYLLEYCKSVLETHLGPRFMAEVIAGGASQIDRVVAETLPLDPDPYIVEEHIRFPLLAAYRKGSKFERIGVYRVSIDEIEVSYVLPPLQAGEAERLMPALKAVASILDNRIHQGSDPAFLPTTPLGSEGEIFWKRAGVIGISVESASYGRYAPTESLHFPCVVLTLQVHERSEFNVSVFDLLSGEDLTIQLEDLPGDVVTAVEVAIQGPPTITAVAPTTGSKAGGTAVSITGTNFVAGTTPTVWFGGREALNVVVVNSTTIQCTTPAYPAATVDLSVVNIDGQSATRDASFTFS